MRRRARQRIVLALLAVGLIVAALWLHHRPGLTVAYQIVDLGVIGGADNSQGTAINNSGQVTGRLFWSNPRQSYAHAFLWRDGRMTDLGVPRGFSSSSGHALNNQGEVVVEAPKRGNGEPSNGAFVPRSAFIFKGGRMTRIATPPGYPEGVATAINDQGQVAGTAFPENGGDSRAFLRQRGSAAGLGTLGALGGLKGDAESNAAGINAGGQITGTSHASGGGEEVSRAFLYSRGKMADLGTLPGYRNSMGNAINDQGQVAGAVDGPDRQLAFLWQGGAMKALGTLPGYANSDAHALNSRGQVIGMAYTLLPLQRFLRVHWLFGGPPDADIRPFLYQNGRMTDLNDLLPARSGWILWGAGGINDRGQIVGSGKHNGQTRAFVLTPVGMR